MWVEISNVEVFDKNVKFLCHVLTYLGVNELLCTDIEFRVIFYRILPLHS